MVIARARPGLGPVPGAFLSDIDFRQVRKVFGDNVVALHEFSLTISSPTLVVLVGPSGCGKTTLLRLIAGLEKPTSGEIMLGDERLDILEARKRDVAMVFQSYALYPHMTVRENLSFGLKIRRTPRDVIAKAVDEVSKSLEIDQLLDRKPGELSGGQRQRVALGRAVIREPKVFLFDEPLSNLDARLRDEMRYLIKRLYQRLKTTTVYVTHDQVEAMTIGELLVVMRDGRIHQVGSPVDCYRRPQDVFVASFLGSPPMNLITGNVDGSASVLRIERQPDIPLPAAVLRRIEETNTKQVVVGVRPEHLTPGAGDGVALTGKIVLEETLGHETHSHLELGGEEIVVRGSQSLVASPDGVVVSALIDRLHFFSKDSGLRLD